jgi:hypothetical protein
MPFNPIDKGIEDDNDEGKRKYEWETTTIERAGRGEAEAGRKSGRQAGQDRKRADSLIAHGCKGHGGVGWEREAMQGVCAVLWVIDSPGERIATHVARRCCSRWLPVTTTLFSAARVNAPLRARLDR